MKFARTITLDESDSRIFDQAAQPGEWAISGTFEFSNWNANDLTGKNKQAFSNGWLGLSSFGRATFVGITAMVDTEFQNVIDLLAQKFVDDYGAPSLGTAHPVAKEEADFMASICDEHPTNTLLMVSREFTPNGIREKFRHIKATDAELEAFAVHGSLE